jgi:citronellol/citronellal dehydrogenase
MTGGTFAGKTILMSGGSRGIGLAIALRAARDGANIAMLPRG